MYNSVMLMKKFIFEKMKVFLENKDVGVMTSSDQGEQLNIHK